MGLHGAPWNPMGLHGRPAKLEVAPWGPTRPYGALWCSVGPNVFPWGAHSKPWGSPGAPQGAPTGAHGSPMKPQGARGGPGPHVTYGTEPNAGAVPRTIFGQRFFSARKCPRTLSGNSEFVHGRIPEIQNLSTDGFRKF